MTACTHPPRVVLCGVLYPGHAPSPISAAAEPQNITEQRDCRPQWCSACGAVRWYPYQDWSRPDPRKLEEA